MLGERAKEDRGRGSDAKEKRDQGLDANEKRDRGPDRFLSATFADLPAPDMKWEEMPPAPVPRLDGAAIQIDNLLYVFSGYRTLDYVIPNFLDFFSCKVFHSLSVDTSSVIVETYALFSFGHRRVLLLDL